MVAPDPAIPPKDAVTVLRQIGMYPGCGFRGLQKPGELRDWEGERACHIGKLEHWEARLSKPSRLAPNRSRAANSLRPFRPFVFWCVLAANVPDGWSARSVRDRLGLVHYDEGAELVRVDFPAGVVRNLSRPTTLDGGVNARFRAVSDAEWLVQPDHAGQGFMSVTVDLHEIRLKSEAFEGCKEAIRLATPELIASGAPREIGTVHLDDDDALYDAEYERRLSGTRSRSPEQLAAFLRAAYAAP